MQLTSTHLRITLVYTVCAGRHAHCVHAHTHVYSSHPAVRYLHHSLNLLSLINPNMRQPKAAVSASTTPPALPRSTKAQESSLMHRSHCKEEWKREVERRRRRSRTEQGSRRWRAGERGFFGKVANPITGSGAAPVSLATLNSHFNGLFLRLPIPFPSIFVPFPDTFSPFCYRARHSRTLSKCASCRMDTTQLTSLIPSSSPGRKDVGRKEGRKEKVKD